MDYSYLEDQIKAAVEVREKGDLAASRKMFEEIIGEIKETMISDTSKELKYIFATATGEFIIQQRLEKPDDFDTTLKHAAALLFYDKQNQLDNPLSLRAVSNTLLSMGKYQEAIPFLDALLPLYQGNSAQEGDTKAHMAFAYLNIGNIPEASVLVNESLHLIEENTAHKEKSFVTNWSAHAYMVKSLVESAQGKTEEAKKSVEKSLKIAKEGKNTSRVLQAQKILNFLSKQ